MRRALTAIFAATLTGCISEPPVVISPATQEALPCNNPAKVALTPYPGGAIHVDQLPGGETCEEKCEHPGPVVLTVCSNTGALVRFVGAGGEIEPVDEPINAQCRDNHGHTVSWQGLKSDHWAGPMEVPASSRCSVAASRDKTTDPAQPTSSQ